MSHETAADQRRLSRFIPLERERECLLAMRNALEAIPGGHCLLLSSIDGQYLAHVAPPRTNSSRLAAIIGSLRGLGETLGKELGQREIRDVIIQTATGVAVVQRIPPPGQRIVLLAAAGSRANMGLVSSHGRFCADTVAAMCFPNLRE